MYLKNIILFKKLQNAIYRGICEGLSLDDDDEDNNDGFMQIKQQSVNSFDEEQKQFALEMQLRRFGICTMLNYEFDCMSFNTINFLNCTYADHQRYFTISINGFLDNNRLDFSSTCMAYGWKIYESKDKDSFINQFPKLKNIYEQQKPYVIYVSTDELIAIIDNQKELYITPTYKGNFPNEIQKYTDNFAFNINDDIILELQKNKLVLKDLISKYHLVPKETNDGNIYFELNSAKSFDHYFNMDVFHYKIKENKNFETKDSNNFYSKKNPSLKISFIDNEQKNQIRIVLDK